MSDSLEGDWQIDGDKEWSIDHCKVLYLISLYAKPALTPTDKEGWIRRCGNIVLCMQQESHYVQHAIIGSSL